MYIVMFEFGATPVEMMWEGINYYKEQAIAKLSEKVDCQKVL